MQCEFCKEETALFLDNEAMKKILDKKVPTITVTATCYRCDKEQSVTLNRKSLILPKET